MREKAPKIDPIYVDRGEPCLNCEMPLDKCDKFCFNCGQKNSIKKLNFLDFFSELFSGLFSYDSRFHRTLRVLLFRPGKISKDYIEGKRMRYANPFRFYLSVSILFFLLFSLNLDPGEISGNAFRDEPTVPSGISEQELKTTNVDSLKKRTVSFPDPQLNPAEVNKTDYRPYYYSPKQLDTMGRLYALGRKIELFYRFYDETYITNPVKALDSLKHPATGFNKWIYKKTIHARTFIENPILFLNYFIGKLPFIIFFYLPVFALFIWLLYLRRPFNYMEHLIFAFHIQTMFFVLYGFAFLIEMLVPVGFTVNLTHMIFLIYLYKGMRNFYGEDRVKTVLKFLLLNILFFTLAVIAAIFSLLASFTLY